MADFRSLGLISPLIPEMETLELNVTTPLKLKITSFGQLISDFITITGTKQTYSCQLYNNDDTVVDITNLGIKFYIKKDRDSKEIILKKSTEEGGTTSEIEKTTAASGMFDIKILRDDTLDQIGRWICILELWSGNEVIKTADGAFIIYTSGTQ